ncbi:hypothetical protein Poli38472_001249 [Pythium oligandrum]|uniref:Apple domain-containing protein n=1 Tax=Pythium oligandrum TaxID=41045 RepID=A0A8K1CUB2_PYTOL|nr:hypothetical protein Poli38472_001249 [Pythium oligandrum]|eukprot:TMW69093.1 hypothetical protein Poli38472_001249 [Pythium oligandrum]
MNIISLLSVASLVVASASAQDHSYNFNNVNLRSEERAADTSAVAFKAEGNWMLSQNCDFNGNDITSKIGTMSSCRKACEENKECTHYSGYALLCWLKKGASGQAVRPTSFFKNECGYLKDRFSTGGSTGPSTPAPVPGASSVAPSPLPSSAAPSPSGTDDFDFGDSSSDFDFGGSSSEFGDATLSPLEPLTPGATPSPLDPLTPGVDPLTPGATLNPLDPLVPIISTLVPGVIPNPFETPMPSDDSSKTPLPSSVAPSKTPLPSSVAPSKTPLPSSTVPSKTPLPSSTVPSTGPQPSSTTPTTPTTPLPSAPAASTTPSTKAPTKTPKPTTKTPPKTSKPRSYEGEYDESSNAEGEEDPEYAW